MNNDPNHQQTELLQVRCCCDTRLLGYLPNKMLKEDEKAVFRTVDGIGCLSFLKRPFQCRADGQTGVAYKSNDYPIEKLRALEGWMDCTETKA